METVASDIGVLKQKAVMFRKAYQCELVCDENTTQMETSYGSILSQRKTIRKLQLAIELWGFFLIMYAFSNNLVNINMSVCPELCQFPMG